MQPRVFLLVCKKGGVFVVVGKSGFVLRNQFLRWTCCLSTFLSQIYRQIWVGIKVDLRTHSRSDWRVALNVVQVDPGWSKPPPPLRSCSSCFGRREENLKFFIIYLFFNSFYSTILCLYLHRILLFRLSQTRVQMILEDLGRWSDINPFYKSFQRDMFGRIAGASSLLLPWSKEGTASAEGSCLWSCPSLFRWLLPGSIKTNSNWVLQSVPICHFTSSLPQQEVPCTAKSFDLQNNIVALHKRVHHGVNGIVRSLDGMHRQSQRNGHYYHSGGCCSCWLHSLVLACSLLWLLLWKFEWCECLLGSLSLAWQDDQWNFQ